MTLSNTAVPIYYGKFRQDVWDGLIPVSQEVSKEMNRIDELIDNPNYYYDDQAIEGFVRYCEAELTLTNGEPLVLLDSFKLWAEAVLAWFYYEQYTDYVPTPDRRGGRFVQKLRLKRLTTKQYLIVARGAAKSMYAACMHAYFLNVDRSTTSQIAVAPTMTQAKEVLSPIKTAITRAPGPLFKYLTAGSINVTSGNKADRVKLASTKDGITNFLTGSKIQVLPMSVDKLQGYRSKLNTVDEWLSGDVREDVIAAIEQGAAKGGDDDFIIIATSSEGTVRNGVGDDIKMELAKILDQEYHADHVSIWWYKLDTIEEVGMPERWIKAQPNLPTTVTYEAYHRDVERAQQAPSTRNDILAKRFGIPREGYTKFFVYEETVLHPYRKYSRNLCSMGCDLSQGDDFTAFTFLFPLPDGRFGIKTRSYVSSKTMAKLQPSMFHKYQTFIAEGSLHVMEGAVLDMMEVYDDLEAFIAMERYEVQSVGYDPYNATEFMNRWQAENSVYGVERVIQGPKTMSVPLGDLKHLAEERMLMFDQLLMSFALGNAVVIEDTNGNRKLSKEHAEAKIDNFAALVDAWVAWTLNKEMFE